MKNNQHSLSESVITQVSYFSQNNPQQATNPLCQLNNNATLLCTNHKCAKPAFICEIKDCQCRKQHQMCYKLEVQSLLKNIQRKPVSIESLETCINDGVEQIIDMLSTYRDETINKLKKDFEFFGLSQNEKEFMKEVKDGKCENVTGSKVWEMIHSERERENITKMVEQTCKSLRSEFQKSKKSFEQTVKEANTCIKKLEAQVDRLLNETQIPKCMKSKEDTLNYPQIQLNQLKILTSLIEFKIIEGFFAPRILKSVKLLYRASENDFDVEKFHEKCDGVADTLTLVETAFSKKIGGYTPIKWNSHTNGVYVSDESMTSFIFSLTEGDKFELTDKAHAVFHYSSYGPIFGCGHDLFICDKANTNDSSCADINYIYENSKYQSGDKQSWLRFCGGESRYFKVKQWQVWRVEFK